MYELVRPINWNRIQDEVDLEVWNKLTQNFWLPEKIALSNDLQSWRELSDAERAVTMKVFAGLTMLDTLQGVVGAVSLLPDSLTPHEEAVLTNISFMESIHAKSYSSIFSTLASTKEIDAAFAWAETNEYMVRKSQTIHKYYKGDDPQKKKVASTILESFLFYSGFYWPLYLSSRAKLTNTADMIRLIIRDECLSGNHELLTPTGWKKISEITTEDTVLQYDPETRVTSFVNPVQTSSHVAENGWYTIRSGQGHVVNEVSPNHRVLVERRSLTAGSSNYKPVVENATDYDADKLEAYTRIINAAPVAGGTVEHLTVEQRLAIAISADGSYDKTKNKTGGYRRSGGIAGTVPVRFTFDKQRKLDRLTKLAAEAGWKLTTLNDARSSNILYVPVSYVDREKRLDNIANLADVTAQWCHEFVEELAEWDGHRVADSERITWGSVRPDEADFVQAIATLAGYRTHYRVITDNRSEKFNDYHRVQIHKSLAHTGGQALTKTKHDEPMSMYGVEVPGGFLVTRNQGAVNITGNSIHGYYIGYKFQRNHQDEKLEAWVYELLLELYHNEVEYTRAVYDGTDRFEDVCAFLRYNANKALMNLGYEPMFPKEITEFDAGVMSALNPNSGENHDFFSGSGSTYIIGKAEETDDDDWDF